jgi:predicted  nucleic acid-binding Zn-ribbon protein
MAKKKAEEVTEMSVEDKLQALYELQTVDTSIDKIRILRGELPLEVEDLEDEVAGLETRIKNFQGEVETLQDSFSKKNNEIIESLALIKKYEEQQSNVRNNREFDSLSKEIEYQTLEIELAEKRKKETSDEMDGKNKVISASQTVLDERKGDLDTKKLELDEIVADTKKEEDNLTKHSEEIQIRIEPRLLTAYQKIRDNARNGLAVVTVQRDACGGCFNKIPPQRQLDIRSRKKVIVCEYCGRILVDFGREEQTEE